MTDQPLLSHIWHPAALPSGGASIVVTASGDERSAIARVLGLAELRRLTAELTVDGGSGGSVRIAGNLHAELAQSCVVSLRPVSQIIAEPIERRFAPERRRSADRSIAIAPEGEDPPDTYAEGGIDLGAIVLEELVLRIDPYPRAEDAVLPAPASTGDDADESPFSVPKTLGHS